MHEKAKLAEAKYFYSRMVEEQTNVESFTCNLSAFLSSSRSVLQYALEEAKNIKGGQIWYDSLMLNSPILRFFKDKRDINIHREPVLPAKNYTLTVTETILFSESVLITNTVKDEKTKEVSIAPNPKSEDKKGQPTPATIQIKYIFDDWRGNEDVLTLSQKYVQELENLVNDGMNKGFIKVKVKVLNSNIKHELNCYSLC